MKMVENLRLFSCLLLFLFTGCAQPTREQIQAFRTVRTVRLIVEEAGVASSVFSYRSDILDSVTADIKEIVENFFTHAKVKVVGTDAETYDATVRIIVERQALEASYSDGDFHYSGARISGSISFEKAGIEAYKEDFEEESSPPYQIPSGSYMLPSYAPFDSVFRESDFKIKVGEMIGKIYGAEVLITSLKDKNDYFRRQVAETLGKIGDPSAVDPLVDALKDENSDVRRQSARTLDKLGWKPTTSNEIIIYYIAKGDWDECIKIGTPAIGPLIKALKDESNYVRQQAAKALGKIGDPRAVDPLVDALKDENGNVRQAAAKALINIGKPAIDPLINALKNEIPMVRHAAAESLGKIGDKRAVDPLISALKDENWIIRMLAAEALGNIGDQRAIEFLKEVAEGDPTSFVRKVARKALDQIRRKRQ